MTFIAELNQDGYADYNDWKLPDRRELFTLVSHEAINPALPTNHPFINVFNSYYWTSTSVARLPDQAWVLYLIDGAVGVGYKVNPEFYLWPVRGEGYNAR